MPKRINKEMSSNNMMFFSQKILNANPHRAKATHSLASSFKKNSIKEASLSPHVVDCLRKKNAAFNNKHRVSKNAVLHQEKMPDLSPTIYAHFQKTLHSVLAKNEKLEYTLVSLMIENTALKKENLDHKRMLEKIEDTLNQKVDYVFRDSPSQNFSDVIGHQPMVATETEDLSHAVSSNMEQSLNNGGSSAMPELSLEEILLTLQDLEEPMPVTAAVHHDVIQMHI